MSEALGPDDLDRGDVGAALFTRRPCAGFPPGSVPPTHEPRATRVGQADTVGIDSRPCRCLRFPLLRLRVGGVAVFHEDGAAPWPAASPAHLHGRVGAL
jgi:hypothetical protein